MDLLQRMRDESGLAFDPGTFSGEMANGKGSHKGNGSEIDAAPRAKLALPKGRNIVILCDGTGNELGGALSNQVTEIRISNVLKLYRIAEKGKQQLVYYTPGVGTVGRIDFLYRWKQKFLGLLGLAMGYGLDDNVLGAYRFLAENWEEGDRIYLFGFSRRRLDCSGPGRTNSSDWPGAAITAQHVR